MTPDPPTAIIKVIRVTRQRGRTCRNCSEGTKERVCGSRRHSGLTTRLRVMSGASAAVRTVGRAAMVQANEAAMLLSAAAMTPLRLVGGGFDGASGSSAPVKAPTTSTTRPVLLVHGLAGTKSSWSLVAHALNARGLTVEAMSYPPLGTSVEQLAEQLVAEVERISCEPVQTRCIWSDTVWAVLSSPKPSPTVVWTAGLTRLSPWARRSVGRPGRLCCRLSRSCGGCGPVTGVAPGRLRAIARRRAVAVGDRLTRHHRARAAFDTIAHPGGNHHLRWCRASRNAPEPTGNRLHNRRVVCTGAGHRR